MKTIKRDLQETIESWMYKGKILIVYGARQVGKTTLVKEILKKDNRKGLYLNCDSYLTVQLLSKADPFALKNTLGDANLVIVDEAQRIPDIGIILKLIHDTYPEIQLIATGSSSFDLSNKINEPLTGRSLEFTLFPFSFFELRQVYNEVEMFGMTDRFIRYGFYPDIIGKTDDEARFLLDNLAGNYLYKDIFDFEQIKKPQLLVKLLQMIAFQVGAEVSVNELAVALQVNRTTIQRYIDLLEKAFVIFQLHGLSRNLRNEITRKTKIYFYDTGVRNSIIANFNPVDLRQDVGALWENLCIAERFKFLARKNRRPNCYFWRHHNQQEIDYIEDEGGQLTCYEFKYSNKKATIPPMFAKTYQYESFEIIHPGNFNHFIE